VALKVKPEELEIRRLALRMSLENRIAVKPEDIARNISQIGKFFH
jgi:predicted RNA-binding protein YlqC (UPF0109 family)